MRRRRLSVAVAVACAALGLSLAAPVAAAPSHAPLQGSGSSWSANAVNQWIADVTREGLQIVFTSSGSVQGRKDFAYKTTDFGVSDTPYLGEDPITHDVDSSLGRQFVYLPIVAGGTSFPYHIEVAGKLYQNLRLSGQTLAGIFTGKITDWDDKAITADNNGHALPSLPIIPIVHSEGSGSTAQFTAYLAKEFPSLWTPYNSGQDISTEYFPTPSGSSNMIGQSGSDSVMTYLKSKAGNGAIAYDEYSYALLDQMPVVKVLNAAGYYTAPTQYNVAVALTKAIINEDPTSQNYLTQDLDNVYSNADRRTYPLSSYSYMIIPTSPKDAKLNAAKAQTLADFLYYSICPGQAEVGPTGYSPLPINLVTAGFSQIAKLKTAQPSIDLSNQNVTTCNNPTFIKGHPTENHLAVIAPQPPSCDQQGQGPCGAGVGLTNGNPTKSGAPASSSGPSAGSGQGSTPGSSASPSTSGPPGSSPSPGSSTSVPGSTQTSPSAVVVQPSGGGGVGTPVAPVTNADVTGVATNLAAYPENNKSPAYGSLAAFVVLLGLAGPAAFLGLRRRRSRTVKDVS